MRPRTAQKIFTTAMTAILFCFGCGLLLYAFGGCNQPTDTGQITVPEQAVTTPVRQDQETGTQGSVIQYFMYFGTQPGALMPAQGVPGLTPALPYVAKTGDPAEPLSDTNTGWSFQNNHFTFTNTTGGTTPTVTGTASGTGAGTLTANPNQTASPVQDVKPELTTSVPIGFAMPGGMVDQQAIATGKGTTSDTGKTSTNRIDYLQMIAQGVKDLGAEAIQEMLDFLKARQAPATQPE